ncbi:MAG: glycosyltransferase [Rhizobiales bacterium]|nr:glycosyltransferase [Hyphomicrobiales bacterium]
MKILHVTPTYLPAVRYGGPIFAVHGLCRALVTRGHQVDVFTTTIDGPDDSNVPLAIPVNLDSVKVHYFASPFLRRLAWAPTMKGVLRQEAAKAAVMHLHSVFLWPTYAAASAARTARTPYVVGPRGALVKKLVRKRNQLLKTAWIALVERSTFEHAAAIHVTSKVEAVELQRFGWNLPRIAVIPNGVDEPVNLVGLPAADVQLITRQQPLVLFLGRLSWVKGLDRLLQAFALTRVGTLAIVGPDYENLLPQLLHSTTKLGIAERVHFLPRIVVGLDKERIFSAAQVLVLPSYSENFGNTILEAMIRSVPVVVTREVGAADIVSQSGGGVVVEGEPNILAEAIAGLLENPQRARQIGQTGRYYVAERYSWSSVAAQMEQLYEEIRVPGHKC